MNSPEMLDQTSAPNKRPFFFMSKEVEGVIMRQEWYRLSVSPSEESPGNFVVVFRQDLEPELDSKSIRQLDRLRREWSDLQ